MAQNNQTSSSCNLELSIINMLGIFKSIVVFKYAGP